MLKLYFFFGGGDKLKIQGKKAYPVNISVCMYIIYLMNELRWMNPALW